MQRWSIRRIRNVLIVLIVVTSLGCVLLFEALPHPDLVYHSLLNTRTPPKEQQWQPQTNSLPMSEWPPLMAFVEESSPEWLASRPLARRYQPTLKNYTYPQVRTTDDIPYHWPVDHPIDYDDHFGPTVGTLASLFPLRFEYAQYYCPVDADPFLPWIHDVIVSSRQVQFVAHNKRRCRTAPIFQTTDLRNLEPQVALFQSVSVKRLTSAERQQLLSSHEQPQEQDDDNGDAEDGIIHRYRLAALDEADPDGIETRFICQFHTYNTRGIRQVVGESLSVFPYNYEHDNYQKKQHPMLTRPKDAQDVHGAHNEQIWNSVLLFSCPIPSTVHGHVHLDLVPIRTPPRESMEGYNPKIPSTFDPKQEWSSQHVIPKVEHSGRWANIPIITESNNHHDQRPLPKQHYLVACTWASAVFQTRGQGATWDFTTSLRLLEWITYHLYIAKVDHIYVYDNTQAFTNDTTSSLERITNLFPTDRVTRIPWKFRVCNNNPPAHRNAGERSSQYTAEASCRIRYGPTTEWMTFLDTDEYLIPQSNWTDLPTWLRTSVSSGAIDPQTHILSFFQTRALPNIQFLKPYVDTKSGGGSSSEDVCTVESHCLAKVPNVTFLQTYDCEPTPLPKPDYGFRAKKQIFRPSFVLNHFVHYTTVTQRIIVFPKEPSPPFTQRRPYERRVDEVTEAFMLHTKTTSPLATAHWQKYCQTTREEKSRRCPVGIAWPLDASNSFLKDRNNVTKDGLVYNCYTHTRIQYDLADRLQNLLTPLQKRLYE